MKVAFFLVLSLVLLHTRTYAGPLSDQELNQSILRATQIFNGFSLKENLTVPKDAYVPTSVFGSVPGVILVYRKGALYRSTEGEAQASQVTFKYGAQCFVWLKFSHEKMISELTQDVRFEFTAPARENLNPGPYDGDFTIPLRAYRKSIPVGLGTLECASGLGSRHFKIKNLLNQFRNHVIWDFK